MTEEDDVKKPAGFVLGAPLDNLSIDELRALMAALEAEKARVAAEIARKSETRNAAESIFN